MPVSIVQGGDGTMWFTDDNNEIGKVTPDGMITEVPLTLSGAPHPIGITPGPDNNIWFTMESPTDNDKLPYIGRLNVATATFTYFLLPASEAGGQRSLQVLMGICGMSLMEHLLPRMQE